ncbi:MAG: ATP-binding protein [Clostridium sp.]|nr:ATP-binding protein [Clostridium sp.]
MNKLEEYFGQASKEQIRSNISRIISSYRNVWDIYVELIQNSADAIIDKFGYEQIHIGKIKLEVDTVKRRLVIIDNGAGIPTECLSKILVTGASIKREKDSGKYGFMGYGFTFVAFQSEYIKISTIHNGKKLSATYKELYKVVFENADIPNSEEEIHGVQEEESTQESGTVIEIIFPQNFPNSMVENNLKLAFKFADNRRLFEYILRTKSACGILDTIFELKENFSFILSVNDIEDTLTTKYFTNREIVNIIYPMEKRIYEINGDKYQTMLSISEDFPEVQKQTTRYCSLLYAKCKDICIGTNNKLTMRVYIEATSKEHLNEFGQSIKLTDEYGGFTIQNGVWLAINGLPTGICLDRYVRSSTLPYTVIVDVLDREINQELDAGRKGITDYRVKQIRDKVSELLSSEGFNKNRQYITRTDKRMADPTYDPKKILLERAQQKEKYNISLVNCFLPPIEEQEVIGLFIELISKEFLKGYKLKILSGYQVYDGLLSYKIEKSENTILNTDNILGISNTIFCHWGDAIEKDIIVEFKKEFRDIYSDVDSNMKDLNDIDLLICWQVDMSLADKLLNERGDVLRKINEADRYLYGTTHELSTTMKQRVLPIIELRTIVNSIFKINVI